MRFVVIDLSVVVGGVLYAHMTSVANNLFSDSRLFGVCGFVVLVFSQPCLEATFLYLQISVL